MKELVEKVAALYADFSKDANAQLEKASTKRLLLEKKVGGFSRSDEV